MGKEEQTERQCHCKVTSFCPDNSSDDLIHALFALFSNFLNICDQQFNFHNFEKTRKFNHIPSFH